MLRRCTKIHDELLEASNHPESEFTVNSSVVIVAKTKKYYEIHAEIDVVTKLLQERRKTLASNHADLDTLIDAVQDEKNRRGSSLYGCRLGKKYIGVDAAVIHSRAFEQGVAKIQDGKESTLTDAERDAVKMLEKECRNFGTQTRNECSASMRTRLAKKRKVESCASIHVDTRFILGSAAEIERLFSTAKLVLSQNRRSMTPQLFEALMFLKYNDRFWNVHLVADAVLQTRTAE